MAERIKELCRCTLSYTALEDTLRSIRAIAEEKGLPHEGWLKLVRSNLEATQKDCGMSLSKVESDVREAERHHEKGDVRGLLAAVETARTQLTLDLLECARTGE